MGLNSKQRQKAKSILFRLFPDQKCFHCDKTPRELGMLEHEIHHRNGDDSNSRPYNIAWACHGCNHLKQYRKDALQTSREPTPEYEVSRERKPMFHKWAWDLLQQNNKHYPLSDLIDSAAYVFDVDIVTIRRWLRPLISSHGPYKIIAMGRLGIKHVSAKGISFSLEQQEQETL